MIIRVTPDRERARSILKMVRTTKDMVGSLDHSRFASNVTKEYYEIIRELLSVLLLLDGCKTYGEGSHKDMICYLKERYSEFSGDVALIDDLRNIRNRISYEGFFV